ncbi:hypothetical protein GCM10017083_13770 [Thalassobaculum fulvum]|uniref:Lipoprotein n=2 Tax=Thalassobaculum fulvum TaxID=1633335 RepID=A0A918XPV5_9PROT|nr:hypothetical protein GCM10017083_13770 [Thalassobaculum fulvum]
MRGVMTALVATAALATLAGCAKSPSSIAPASVSSNEYDHLTCKELQREQREVDLKLADATSRQNSAQTADAVGVFLVLIPVSALTGDAEGDVARYKGEKIAIERSITRRDC